MLINLTNHPSHQWQPEQKKVARQQFGEVVDIPFPEVPPEADERWIVQTAHQITQAILTRWGKADITVLVQGEFTLTYALVRLLHQQGITCVSVITRREILEEKDGTIVRRFRFLGFRKYPAI